MECFRVSILIGCFILISHFGSGQASGSRCEAGWEYREDKCYKLFYPATPSISIDTNALCKKSCAVPASIRSQQDNDWITDFSLGQLKADGKFPGISRVVLGVRKGDGDSLVWDSAGRNAKCPLKFQYWSPGNPRGGATIYMSLIQEGDWKAGQWDDISDTNKLDYPAVCVKPAKGASPSVVYCDYKEGDSPKGKGQCSQRQGGCSGGCGCGGGGGCGCGCRCGCGCGC